MKIGGVTAERGGELKPLVFQRGESFLVFRAKPVYDLTEFEALCPDPDPKQFGGRYTKTGFEFDPEAPAYLDAVKRQNKRFGAYLLIKSLEPSAIEWQRVQLTNPDTWKYAEEELKAVLTWREWLLVNQLVNQANSLDDAKLEENRESFFQQQRESVALRRSLTDEAESTSSGELANVSD